jgi:RNA polymerase sigma factor (sigma-70 family)
VRRIGRREAIDVESRNAIVATYSYLLRPIAAAIARRVRGVSLDDLEQAGALGLIDAASHYSPDRESTFAAYVRMRVRGAMLDSLDGRWRTDVTLDGELIDGGTDPLAACIEAEQRAALELGIARLSARQRAVMALRYRAGVSQRRAAAELGISQAAVCAVERRALANLRSQVIGGGLRSDLAGMGKVVEIARPPSPEEIAQAVDELGALSVRIAELRRLQDRYDQLRRKVVGWYDGEPAGQSFALEGAHFAAEVSARAIERRIRSMLALYRAIGQRKFLAHCQFPLSALDEIMAPADQERFVVSAQTGPRRLKVFARLETAA